MIAAGIDAYQPSVLPEPLYTVEAAAGVGCIVSRMSSRMRGRGRRKFCSTASGRSRTAVTRLRGKSNNKGIPSGGDARAFRVSA
jgi:hypothetical protein